MKNNIPIGYWPASLLGSLKHSAIIVQWGGQVYSPQVKKSPHTGTDMGSGEFPTGRYGNACYMRNVRIKDYSQQLKYPEPVSTFSQEPDCYNALNDAKYGKEPYFYFGGPGRSPIYCPWISIIN